MHRLTLCSTHGTAACIGLGARGEVQSSPPRGQMVALFSRTVYSPGLSILTIIWWLRTVFPECASPLKGISLWSTNETRQLVRWQVRNAFCGGPFAGRVSRGGMPPTFLLCPRSTPIRMTLAAKQSSHRPKTFRQLPQVSLSVHASSTRRVLESVQSLELAAHGCLL